MMTKTYILIIDRMVSCFLQVQRMIDMIDTDGTGTLNYEEFLIALKGNHLVD